MIFSIKFYQLKIQPNPSHYNSHYSATAMPIDYVTYATLSIVIQNHVGPHRLGYLSQYTII